jgi:hypothetical protein
VSWLHRERPRTASLDKALVLATWWVITRSMVLHCCVLGIMLIFFTDDETAVEFGSYELILYWAPSSVWGLVIILAALTWLLTRGMVCVIAGVGVSLWFFAFASAFFAAMVTQEVPGTAVTGWATYGFLGWAWLCVTYVVWKDDQHVREEAEQLSSIAAMSEEIEIRTENGNGKQPDAPQVE